MRKESIQVKRMSGKTRILSIIKNDRVIDTVFLITLVVVCCIYFFINVPQSSVNIVRTVVDGHIARVPIFSIAYLYFLPWLWISVFYLYLKRKSFRQLAYSLIMMNLIAFCVYLFFQTYIPREAIPSTDFYSDLLRFIYDHDQPYNGFPSLHCAMSASLASSFVIRRSRFAWFFVLSASLVIASTLFTKQHFILDAVSGVALGVLITWVVYKMFPEKDNK